MFLERDGAGELHFRSKDKHLAPCGEFLQGFFEGGKEHSIWNSQMTQTCYPAAMSNEHITAAHMNFNAQNQQTAAIRHQTQVAKKVAYDAAQEKEGRARRLEECFKEFESMNEGSLVKMSDRDLALFQSKYPDEAPQSRLALHEWNRRLVVAQLKEARFGTITTLVGTLIGTVLGVVLGLWLS